MQSVRSTTEVIQRIIFVLFAMGVNLEELFDFIIYTKMNKLSPLRSNELQKLFFAFSF